MVYTTLLSIYSAQDIIDLNSSLGFARHSRRLVLACRHLFSMTDYCAICCLCWFRSTIDTVVCRTNIAVKTGWMAQTPLHGHRLRTCCATPPTDNLTTILQLVVGLQQICHIAMPERLQHLDMSRCWMWQIFVRWWWICCATSCRIVVSSSVGGVVQHVRTP